MIIFANRKEAGRSLSDKLRIFKPALRDPIVLGIPRGGIAVGYYVAKTLGAEFDAIVLRKLPIPYNSEAGFGAVTLDRVVIFNGPLLSRINLSEPEINKIIDNVYKEVLRRNRLYRKGRLFPDLKGRSVIITDDGLASGFSMLAAIRFVRKQGAMEIISAVPVAHQDAYRIVNKEADRTVSLHISRSSFFAVASFYKEFPDMNDKEVIDYLEGPLLII